MTKRRSERSRWVQVFYLPESSESSSPQWMTRRDEKARAVVLAFERVGRVVRVETTHGGLVFKARKA